MVCAILLPGPFLTRNGQTSWPATVVPFPQAAMQRSFRSLTMIPLSPGRVWSSRWLWLLLCYKPLAAAAAFHPALSCFPTPACVGAGSQFSLNGYREHGVLQASLLYQKHCSFRVSGKATDYKWLFRTFSFRVFKYFHWKCQYGTQENSECSWSIQKAFVFIV